MHWFDFRLFGNFVIDFLINLICLVFFSFLLNDAKTADFDFV